MGAWIAAAFGTACYVFFIATFLYAIGFVGNSAMVPKAIDSGDAGPIGGAIFLEERDLIHQFGDRYQTYRRQVGMLLPRASKVRDSHAAVE